jgi:hypothetical protein
MSIAIEEYQVTGGPPVPGGIAGHGRPLVLLDENGKKPKNVRVETFAIDEFKEGTRFRDAVNLYVFDKQLRTLALDALERIEVAIRVEISHTLCLTQARTAVRGFCSQLEFGYMPHAAAPVVWQASAVGRARARNSSNTTRLSTGCRWRCGLLAKLGTWYVVHALQRHARAGAGQDRRPLWPERRACFCHLVTQPELFAQRLRTPQPPLESKCRRSAQALPPMNHARPSTAKRPVWAICRQRAQKSHRAGGLNA